MKNQKKAPRKGTKPSIGLRDLRPEKDAKGGGEIPITKLTGSSTPTLQK